MSNFLKNLEYISVKITPALITLLLLFTSLASSRFSGSYQIMPSFVIISIYYFGIFIPSSLSYIFLFILGIIEDSFIGAPLGISALGNIILRLIITRNLRFFHDISFNFIWLVFVILSSFLALFNATFISIYNTHLASLDINLMQLLVTWLTYPLIHSLFSAIYKRIDQ
ncbi:MAG: rod shape-determining protein MreD [Pseudomonadota bacterium]